jgi:hypothetical protein
MNSTAHGVRLGAALAMLAALGGLAFSCVQPDAVAPGNAALCESSRNVPCMTVASCDYDAARGCVLCRCTAAVTPDDRLRVVNPEGERRPAGRVLPSGGGLPGD